MISLRLLCRSSFIRSTCHLSATRRTLPLTPLCLQSFNPSATSRYISTTTSRSILTNCCSLNELQGHPIRLHSTVPESKPPKKRFRLIVKTLKEYGPVFVIFHTCTSILTVVVFYILVSRLVTCYFLNGGEGSGKESRWIF